MVRVKKFSRMVQNTKATMSTGSEPVMVPSDGQMGSNTQVISRMTRFKVKANVIGRMDAPIREDGLMGNSMVEVSSKVRMARHTKEITFKIKSTAMEFTNGRMVGNMKAAGLMVSNMALVITLMLPASRSKDCGLKVRESSGSTKRLMEQTDNCEIRTQAHLL